MASIKKVATHIQTAAGFKRDRPSRRTARKMAKNQQGTPPGYKPGTSWNDARNSEARHLGYNSDAHAQRAAFHGSKNMAGAHRF